MWLSLSLHERTYVYYHSSVVEKISFMILVCCCWSASLSCITLFACNNWRTISIAANKKQKKERKKNRLDTHTPRAREREKIERLETIFISIQFQRYRDIGIASGRLLLALSLSLCNSNSVCTSVFVNFSLHSLDANKQCYMHSIVLCTIDDSFI